MLLLPTLLKSLEWWLPPLHRVLRSKEGITLLLIVWFAMYANDGDLDAHSLEKHKSIIDRITTEKACASAIMDGKVVGISLGVLAHKWLGLFSLITLAPYRRKGVATSINRVLALWGKRNDAQKVYLQVVPENKPAFALYQELGFKELYHYWYRWLP